MALVILGLALKICYREMEIVKLAYCYTYCWSGKVADHPNPKPR